MKKIRQFLKSKSQIFWIYSIAILLINIITIIIRPKEAGLYTFYPQFIPLIFAIVFFFFKSIYKNYKESIYIYGIIQFIFLAVDYLQLGHAGIIQISVTFIPLFIFWLIIFSIWNYKQIKNSKARKAFLLSSIAWILYAFAFPPLPLGPLSLIILVPWFIVLNQDNRDNIIFGTFWSGMIYNTINYYWIYNVMNVETAPSGLICFGVILLITYFSAYNVFAAFIFTIAREIKLKNKPYLLFFFPLFYAGLEMTRTRGDFAFPWSHLGYAMGSHLELIQMLSFIGIFGYTILIVFSNMIVAKTIIKSGFKNKWPLSIPLLIIITLLIHGNIVLSKKEAQNFYGSDSIDSPQIALIQPSIKQGEKWSKERYDRITSKTFSMIKDSVPENTNIIILAETAIPDHIRRQPQTIRKLHKISEQYNASILTGALDYKRNEPNNPRRYDIYNASFLFTPEDSKNYKRYIKKHLVPFSERIPFDDIFPILNYVDLGEGDFVPGTETPVYEKYKWTPFICYDAIFGDLVRDAINAGSRLMVNITNDGWFGKSTAPYQHLNLVRFRAIENGMPTVRLANSGITAFIDQYGHYDKKTEIFTERVVIRKMQLKTRDTLYQHIGDSVETALLWFFFFYLTLCMILKIKQKARTKASKASALT